MGVYVHAGSRSSEEYAVSLSQQRALSTQALFHASATQLTAKGMGESKPVANNATKEERSMDRRCNWCHPRLVLLVHRYSEMVNKGAVHIEWPPVEFGENNPLV